MDFKELVEQTDANTLDQLAEANRLLWAYRQHVRDGLTEALEHWLVDVMDDIVRENCADLYLTCNHLLEDDPDVHDEAEAAYGNMLASANMNAGLAMLSFLREHSDALKDVLQKITTQTIDDYRELDFEEPEEVVFEADDLWEEDEEPDE